MAKNIVSLEVINFDEELKRIEEEARKIVNLEMASKIDYATNQLRVVTPVDTGEARSGWSSEISKDSQGNTLGTIENPVEHIVYLNNGHSKQAPKYFIEQVLSTIGLIKPE